MTPYYQDDHVTIYHGDAFDMIDQLQFDVIVTDPPYGINATNNRPKTRSVQYDPIIGDNDQTCGRWLMGWIRSTGTTAVVFGAVHWPDVIPERGKWICWDKRCGPAADKMVGHPFELAWSNLTGGWDRMVRVQHGGVVNDNGANLKRLHPTEKPIRLMSHVLNLCPPGVILDPFMGSGTTLRAAKDLGHRAIGIEIEERYCEIAARRMGQEVLPI